MVKGKKPKINKTKGSSETNKIYSQIQTHTQTHKRKVCLNTQ